MRLRGILLLAGIALIGFSCKKDNDPVENDVAGTITYTSPIAGSVYDNGFVINIEGEMADNNRIGTAKLEIRNKTTNALLNTQSVNLGTVTFYRFDWSWPVTGITAATPAIVRVLNIDKLGNIIQKDVEVTLNP